MYDQILTENLKEIMEGMITGLQRELRVCEHTCQQKISTIRDKNSDARTQAFQEVDNIAKFLVRHAAAKSDFSYPRRLDTNSCIAALRMDITCHRTSTCNNLSEAAGYLQALKTALLSLDTYY